MKQHKYPPFCALLCTAPGTFQDGNIRLVGGSNNWEGRVEMYMAETWGIISDTSWTTTEAQVVCRQLGHSAEGEYTNTYSSLLVCMIYR